jgi:N-sulfoglucosamine sulfohydrolase
MRWCAVVLAIAGCSLSLPVASATELGRRNVVLLVADDLGLDLGCYGNPAVRTPNLDALAQSGVRFTNAFATVASCSASRAVLYTGLYTHSNGQFGHAHQPANLHTHGGVRSLPRVLRDAGYRTGVIGKLHVQPPAVYPFDLEITTGLGGNRNVVEMAKKAREFFAEASGKPFFLIIGFADPHRAARGFGNEQTRTDVAEVRYDPQQVRLPYFLPDLPDVRQELAEYYQAATRMDRGVGLIRKALEETGNADNTLVIFLSDNGIPFPGAKTTLYDSGLHLPLLVSVQTLKRRGLTNEALVSWVDITPTVLDWAGVKAPTPLPGRSVLPILEEENPKGWDVVYGSHVFHEITMYYPMRMIRTRQHKYILNLAHQLDYPFASDLYGSQTWQAVLRGAGKMLGERTVHSYIHRPREELYDLTRDPNELKNVAASPAYTGVLADLRNRLKDWQEKTGDPWIVKYKYE